LAGLWQIALHALTSVARNSVIDATGRNGLSEGGIYAEQLVRRYHS
jgi:hypothetical protein